MCYKLVGEGHFIYDEYINVNLTEQGEVEVSYSAYSTDSSFDTKWKFKYCPYCGKLIKDVIKEYKSRQDKLAKAEEKKELDRLEREKLQRAEFEERLRIKRETVASTWDSEVARGICNVYADPDKPKMTYKAYSRDHLASILGISKSATMKYKVKSSNRR